MSQGDKRENILEKSQRILDEQRERLTRSEECILHGQGIQNIEESMAKQTVDIEDIKLALLGDGIKPGIVTTVAVQKKRIDQHDKDFISAEKANASRFKLAFGLIAVQTAILFGMAYSIIERHL